MRLIDSESLYQRFLDYKLKHPTKYTDIDEIRIVISDEPTVDVLEQITGEIRQIVDEETEHDEKWARGLHYSLCIIDKYKEQTE